MIQTGDVQVVQADPGQGVRRRPPGLPDGAAAPPLREAGLGRDHGRDPVLHPRPASARWWPSRRSRCGEHARIRFRALARQRPGSGGRRAGQERGGRGAAAARSRRRRSTPPTPGPAPTFDALGRERCAAAGAAVELGGHDLERIARAAAVVVAPGVPPDAPPLGGRAPGRRPGPCRDRPRLPGAPRRPAASASPAPTARRRPRRWSRTCSRRPGSEPRRRATSGGRSARWPGRGRRRSGSRSSSRRSSCTTRRTSSPQVGVLTNLAPNHLDRYRSLEEYYGDKALLFRNADAESVWVSNADDPAVAGDGRGRCRAAPPVLGCARGPTAGTTATAAG